MSSIISPNMNLIVPSVGSESGPQYAYDINSSLTLIDQHDHSPGKGVLITPSGINIISALNFNGNPASNLSYESFIAGSAPSTIVQSVSVAPSSSINELFYTDSNGTSTQITKNGVVNATASSIPGESYDAGTFIWVQGSGSTTPANFDIGSIILRPNTAGTTNGVTLSPPSSISSAYTINLPSLPSTTSVLLINSSGVMSTISGAAGTVLVGGSTPSFQPFVAPTVTNLTPSSSSPYTPPSGVLYIRVVMIGAGGGGGGTGTTTPGNGSNGGNTTFGTFSVGGGGGGFASDNTAPAGGGGGNVLSASGLVGYSSQGGNGSPGSGDNGVAGGTNGLGGVSQLAGAGTSGASGQNGNSGMNGSGGGGGGPAVSNSFNYPGGGGGGAGGYIETIISSPGTISYSVGSGGGGGSAGANGHSGGSGGNGLINIYEYYS